MEILSRSYYAKKIDSWLGSGLIIVLIGQRRVGKSYVMKDFIARHEKEADANIIYIDKEKRSFRFISNCDELDAHIDPLLLPDKHNYILIDEVQDIEGWEKSLRSYRTEENVVYHHLIHLGYSVTVGQLRAGEIDFVCSRPNQRVYVQVAWIIDSDATFKREFGALQAIGDAYPKYVISATPLLRSANHEGITHLHLRTFLTEGFGKLTTD